LVNAGLTPLLDDGDRQLLPTPGLLHLGKAQRRRQAARPGANDQDINFKRFAIHSDP
jgi:hypothetical protein